MGKALNFTAFLLLIPSCLFGQAVVGPNAAIIGGPPTTGIIVVQAASNSAFSASTTTATIAPISGHTLIAIVLAGGTTPTFTSLQTSGATNFTSDTSGNWIAVGASFMGFFHLASVGAGVTGVTLTISATGTPYVGLIVYEVSGLASQAKDVNSASFSSFSTNPISSASVTTTNANDIVLGGCETINGGAVFSTQGFWAVPSNGSTSAAGTIGMGMSYQVVSSTAAYVPQMNSTVSGGGCISGSYK